jgi:multidrug efflux pump subunit AcrB
MVIILLFGLLGLLKLNVQSLPDFGFDLITISVDWKSASPRDVENQIIKSIEPEVRTIDGVRKVNSTAREGVGQLSIEFVKNTDMQRALSDVSSAVSRILSLPEDSEKPKVRRIIRYETVGRLLLYGDISEELIRNNAKKIRDDLLNLGIDKVNILGMRDKEIVVALDPLSLMTFKKSMQDISDKIYAFSEDFPVGTIKDADIKKIKISGQKNTIEQLKDLSIISGEFGEQVYLRDIANIYINYDSEGQYGLVNNKQAISLDIKRATGRNSLKMAKILENYVVDFQKNSPPNLNVKIYDLSVQSVRDRINLLIKNGLGGLVLVVIILFLFLSGRVAFWVAFGIPIALAGTLGVMLISGQTINMVSLFALIMMLGIIVDDAIVVAEYAQTRHEEGDDSVSAARKGASKMFLPVFTAAITTVAAFIPIFLITGIIGQVIEAIPLVAIAVLIASLVECFLILPGHLSLALKNKKKNISKFRIKFNKYFFIIRQNYFRKLVGHATKYRYVTLSTTLSVLIIVLGLMSGGRVSFVFFPSPEPDIIYVNFNFSPGTSKENTSSMITEL